jgi:hypothetical protein
VVREGRERRRRDGAGSRGENIKTKNGGRESRGVRRKHHAEPFSLAEQSADDARRGSRRTTQENLKLKVNVYRKQTQTKQAQEIQERSKGVSPGIQNEQQDHGDEKQRGDPNKSRVGAR